MRTRVIFRRSLVAGLLSSLAGAGADVFSQGSNGTESARDEIFREVFKHPPPNFSIGSFVALTIDDSPPQKIRAALLQGGRELLLDGESAIKALAPLLRPEVLRTLRQKIDRDGWLSREALESAGVTTAFDLRAFQLTIRPPPAMRERRIQYLNFPLADPFRTEAIRPALISGFLNFNLKATRTNRATDVGFAADGAVNVTGTVLEGSILGGTTPSRSLQRGDLRLVHDEPKRTLRYTFGDLRYPTIGYQTTMNLLGIGVSKDFSLQPHLSADRANPFEFFLDRPAEVKTWVNDSLVSTLHLPAGAQDIRGLIPNVGQNDVRVIIEDDAGRREALHFAFIYDPTLLEKGRSIFSYNIGVRRRIENGVYQYDFKQPALSGSYLKGVTAAATFGGYAQVNTQATLAGFRAIHAFSLGTLLLDTAASEFAGNGWDIGTRLELTSTPPRRGRPGFQSQVSVEFRGSRFGSVEARPTRRDDALDFLASIAVPVGHGITAQFSGRYSPSREAATSDHSITALLTRRWGRSTTGTVMLRRIGTSRGESTTELRFGLSVSFARGASSFYATKELESDAVTARWNSGRPSNATTPYGFAATHLQSDQREYEGGVGYWGNAGLVEAAYTRKENVHGTSLDKVDVRLQSALVFAGNTFALGRQIAENFAIVKGQESLAETGMKIDPDSTGGSNGRSSWLSPAVLTDLASYRVRNVRVEPINPPLGSTVEKSSFVLAPTYKSGFLLKLGGELKIVAVGRLVDESHAPFGHQPFEIRRVGEPDRAWMSTFTSRAGTFQISDLRPGRHELRLSTSSGEKIAIVEIRESHDGLCRIGDVVVR